MSASPSFDHALDKLKEGNIEEAEAQFLQLAGSFLGGDFSTNPFDDPNFENHVDFFQDISSRLLNSLDKETKDAEIQTEPFFRPTISFQRVVEVRPHHISHNQQAGRSLEEHQPQQSSSPISITTCTNEPDAARRSLSFSPSHSSISECPPSPFSGAEKREDTPHSKSRQKSKKNSISAGKNELLKLAFKGQMISSSSDPLEATPTSIIVNKVLLSPSQEIGLEKDPYASSSPFIGRFKEQSTRTTSDDPFQTLLSDFKNAVLKVEEMESKDLRRGPLSHKLIELRKEFEKQLNDLRSSNEHYKHAIDEGERERSRQQETICELQKECPKCKRTEEGLKSQEERIALLERELRAAQEKGVQTKEELSPIPQLPEPSPSPPVEKPQRRSSVLSWILVFVFTCIVAIVAEAIYKARRLPRGF